MAVVSSATAGGRQQRACRTNGRSACANVFHTSSRLTDERQRAGAARISAATGDHRYPPTRFAWPPIATAVPKSPIRSTRAAMSDFRTAKHGLCQTHHELRPAVLRAAPRPADWLAHSVGAGLPRRFGCEIPEFRTSAPSGRRVIDVGINANGSRLAIPRNAEVMGRTRQRRC